MSRLIVNIHGTGRTSSDFWVPQVAAVAAQLGWEPPHLPVWWGDLIDVGAVLPAFGDQVNRWLNQAWPDVGVFSRLDLTPVHQAVGRVFDLCHRVTDAAAGVVAYFTSSRMQESIRNRLRAALNAATRQGHEVVLVSQSLGCLIAFDVLREEAHRHRIHTWFTMGCALGTLVWSGRRPSDLGAISTDTVRHWRNLYSEKDPIGEPLSAAFPGYPISDELVVAGDDPLTAHRYWDNPHVARLIAEALLD